MKWFGCSDLIGVLDLEHLSLGRKWCLDPVVPEDVAEPWGFVGCIDDLDGDTLYRRLRAAGRDPLGAGVLVLSPAEAGDAEWIRARLDAERGRVAAYRGTRPEHLKLVMPAVVSRRTLLSLRAPAYRAVPRPEPTACRAEDGCRACAEICPHGALEWSKGVMEHDRVACTGCGRCISACPAGAMVNPAFTAEQMQAQLRALVAGLSEPFGVRFSCARIPASATEPPWVDLRVPCVAMLPVHWLVGTLLAGASAVAVEPCGCGQESDAVERAERTRLAARRMLAAAGIESDRIDPDHEVPLGPPIAPPSADVSFEPTAAPIGLALAPIAWGDPLAAAGLVNIDEGLCTGCEMCATVCPADALRAIDTGGTLTIDFDPMLCNGCAQCLARCPEEGALAIRTAIDSSELDRGVRVLATHVVATCAKCGGPVATETVLERLGARLDDEVVLKQISSLCLDCRGTTMIF
jgi:ferredoxin